MRIPRDIDGKTLVKLLERYGYGVTRQTGSHIRLTSNSHVGEHHITIPNHKPLRIGTINSVITDVAGYLNVNKGQIIQELFN
ncbi:MAG TPA: type II toxin-antitoxin system HicA family toxin [Syntrophomonadaceae bacterium]|nr:type II toxin-antitoxin system HicA family toxin [Syntrophomonadaceae bacterium]